jgi:hypothetical protein
LHPEDTYRFIEIDLNSIKYAPPPHKKAGKPYSPEDSFMMSQA